MWGTDDQGKSFRRPYTPISNPLDTHSMDLLVKVYRPTETYPHGGKLTQWLERLEEGQHVHISGPVGKCIYLGNSVFEFTRAEEVLRVPFLTVIAGGSGITPFYQLLLAFQFEREKDPNLVPPQVRVVYFNKSEEDILLHQELLQLKELGIIDQLCLGVEHSLNPKWKGEVGLLTLQILRQNAWKIYDQDHMVFFCGNPAMNQHVLTCLDQAKMSYFFKY